MLYQLSYAPDIRLSRIVFLNIGASQTKLEERRLVGLSRLERLTSPLSAECSNQLSYRPSEQINMPE